MPAVEPHQRLPLIVLAGSARKWEAVTEHGDRLVGPKGVKIRVEGRPLIDVIVERFAAVGLFEPIFIAGPAKHYGEQRGVAEVIDTDTDFGGNIRNAVDTIVPRLAPEVIAFTTCDVIPDPAELEALAADYLEHAPVDFWFPLIKVPEDPTALGASAGKRRYRVRPDGQRKPVVILPGHLSFVRPAAMRQRLLYDCFELAYRSRTKPFLQRFFYIVRRVLWLLLREDARALVAGRPPFLTIEALYNATRLVYGVSGGVFSQRLVENRLRRIFTTRRYRRAHRDRRGRLPVIEGLSLAKDIDTRSEAEDQQVQVAD